MSRPKLKIIYVDKVEENNDGAIKSPTKSKRGTSILTDLNKLSFPDDIKQTANDIYQKMILTTHRNTKRQRLIFLCIMYAYREKGIDIEPRKIIEELGLENADMTRAISAFSEAKTGYSPTNQRKYPTDYLPSFCRDIGIEPIEPILELAKKILAKDGTLLGLYPQTVAAGILRYYMHINGIIINSTRFTEIVGLSEATVNNMKNRIAIIDNA